jgi:WD40 repeat protein
MLRQWHAHDGGAVTALAWAPDEAVLATAGADGVLKLWSFLAGMRAGLAQVSVQVATEIWKGREN